ncbi:unnamed protein product [Bemisia tabaci]|uniref:peptidylprolyl isomerase n=1 Tax=Bemisia tabaci TaxID=7038 RepID=A0A9P0EVY8_BEMTA|nr:unnamed protein product [Bemisia tabaci]
MLNEDESEMDAFNYLKLDEPLDTRPLLNGESLEVSMMSQEGDSTIEMHRLQVPELYFNANDLLTYVDLTVKDSGCEVSPFEQIKLSMTELPDSEGKVSKKIVEAGIGEICPPDAFVKFHYVAFNEYDEVPFDVSKLRRKFPESKKLGSGELIPGLELGIATMRKKEKAHFIIHYDFAFGILGCGERIPPKSSLLYKVELLDFERMKVPENEDFENAVDEELSFQALLKKAEGHIKQGTYLKKEENNNHRAIKEYKTAVNILSKIPLNSDAEEKMKKHAITRAYVNLAICHNYDKRYRLVCTVFKDALYEGGEEAKKDAKLHYNYAKAQCGLLNFDLARKMYRQVKVLDPSQQDRVDSLIKDLERKQRQVDEDHKVFKSNMSKMFK